MKRYIVIAKYFRRGADSIFEVEHSFAHPTMREAAESQIPDGDPAEYACAGFRIVELEGEDEV